MRIAIAAALLSLSPFAAGCCRRATPQLQSRDSTPSAAPDPLDFGNVPVGGTKVLPLVLTNRGTLELDLSSVAITQGQAGTPEFAFTEQTNPHAPFGATLAPGASAQAYLAFQPVGRGEQQATLAIKSNSSATPEYDVPLRGNATSVVIVVKPEALDFGGVQVGTQATLTVTVTNQGTDASDPIVVQPVIGTQARNFGWTGTPGVLQPNGSFKLRVTFSPAVQGPASALIPFLDCATCNPGQISLTGVGVDGELVFSPSPVSFLKVPVDSTATATVTLRNLGLAAVALQSLSLKNPSGPFAVTGAPTLPTTLATLGSLSLTVSYTATNGGNDQELLTAISQPLDGSGQPSPVVPETATDQLFGNGTPSPCSLRASPPALNFGNPPIGTPTSKTVTLSNLGQENCVVTGLALGAGTDPAFTLAATPPSLTVAPGQSATVVVACDLTSTAPPLLHRGSLVFSVNDPLNPSARIPLSAYVKGNGPYADGWPKWHMGNTDQGQSLADTSGNLGTVLWRFNVGLPQSAGGILGSINPNPTYMNSPVVGPDGTVYQLGMDGTFYAVDPGGNELWKTSLLPPNPDEHPATPILAADNTLYIETGTDGASFSSPAQLYHIDAATGKILFQVGPPSGAGTGGKGNNGGGADGFDVNPSIGQDGLLFDGDDFGQTVTYSTGAGGSVTQGSEVILPWNGERVAVALDAADNSYWCSSNLCFGVTSPAQGFQPIPAWPASGLSIGGSGGLGFSNSDLAFDENQTGWLMIEVGTQTGSTGQTTLAAVDPANGNVQWSRDLPSGPTPSSFSAFTGAGIFSSDVGNSAPAIATDGTVYVGNVDGLYAVVGATGATKPGFPFTTPADVESAAAIGGDGTVFFGTADGTFYAVKPDGSLRFKLATGGRISSSPAIGPDGTVFFVSDDGNLTAVR